MKVLMIIPCYNEELNIVNVYKDIKPILKYCDYIYVNDCSKDNSLSVLQENKLEHLNLPINLGLSGAVQAGYKYAYDNGYDAAIQFDGDGQHKSEYITQMIECIVQGNDIVVGSRFVTEKKPINARMLGSRLISLLIYIKTGKKISDPTSGMRMINRSTLYDFAYNLNRKPEPDTICLELARGKKVKEVQVDMNDRCAGESYLNTWNSIKYMLKTCISIIFFS